MSPQERSSKMLELANKWPESGMTQLQYAETNNLSVHKLKYWLYKRKGEKATSFVQISDLCLGQKFVIRYPQGVELKIASTTPISVIRSLINL
jgi:hypothetical protein